MAYETDSPGAGSPRAQADDPEDPSRRAVTITRPAAEDGADVHDLIAACPPLDGNSLYANLLQCSHFAGTCALARDGEGRAVGWVSGYIPPEEPETFFLWQVAVHEKARGLGLPKRLIADILTRPECAGVRWLKTTITPGNEASWGLFRSVARWLDAPMKDAVLFDRDAHFRGRHDSESLVTIGPFARPEAPA